MSSFRVDVVPKENWVKDAKKCKGQGCDQDFGFFSKGSNCSCCGEMFCKNCLSQSVALPPTYPAQQPVCILCMTTVEQQRILAAQSPPAAVATPQPATPSETVEQRSAPADGSTTEPTGTSSSTNVAAGVEALQVKLKELVTKSETLREENESIGNVVEEQKKHLAEWAAKEEDLVKKEKEVTEKITAVEARQEELSRVQAQLIKTKEKLDTRKKELEAREKEVSEKVPVSASDVPEEKAKEEKAEEFSKKQKEVEDKEAELNGLQTRLEEMQVTLKTKEEQLKSDEEKVLLQEKQLQEEMQKVTVEKQSLTAEREDLKKQREALKAETDELEAKENKFRSVQVEADTLKAQLQELQSTLHAKEQELQGKEAKLLQEKEELKNRTSNNEVVDVHSKVNTTTTVNDGATSTSLSEREKIVGAREEQVQIKERELQAKEAELLKQGGPSSTGMASNKRLCDLEGAEKESARQRIFAFYQKHNPAEAEPKTETALQMDATEGEIMEKLCQKYKVDPASLQTTAAAPSEAQPLEQKTEQAPPAAERTLRDRVLAMYQKYKPNKVHTAETSLQQYAGQEQVLLDVLVQKWGPEPEGPPSATPSASTVPTVAPVVSPEQISASAIPEEKRSEVSSTTQGSQEQKGVTAEQLQQHQAEIESLQKQKLEAEKQKAEAEKQKEEAEKQKIAVEKEMSWKEEKVKLLDQIEAAEDAEKSAKKEKSEIEATVESIKKEYQTKADGLDSEVKAAKNKQEEINTREGQIQEKEIEIQKKEDALEATQKQLAEQIKSVDEQSSQLEAKEKDVAEKEKQNFAKAEENQKTEQELKSRDEKQIEKSNSLEKLQKTLDDQQQRLIAQIQKQQATIDEQKKNNEDFHKELTATESNLNQRQVDLTKEEERIKNESEKSLQLQKDVWKLKDDVLFKEKEVNARQQQVEGEEATTRKELSGIRQKVLDQEHSLKREYENAKSTLEEQEKNEQQKREQARAIQQEIDDLKNKIKVLTNSEGELKTKVHELSDSLAEEQNTKQLLANSYAMKEKDYARKVQELDEKERELVKKTAEVEVLKQRVNEGAKKAKDVIHADTTALAEVQLEVARKISIIEQFFGTEIINEEEGSQDKNPMKPSHGNRWFTAEKDSLLPPLDVGAVCSVSSVVPPPIRGDLTKWEIDVLEFGAVLPAGNVLPAVAWHCASNWNLLDATVPSEAWASMMHAVEKCYNPVSYHNVTHSAFVVQAVYAIVHMCPKLLSSLTSLEKAALLFAAAIHDIHHPGGVSNSTLSKLWDPCALEVHRCAILEQHHLKVAFHLMAHQSLDITSLMDDATAIQFHAMVSKLVLATDMDQHHEKIQSCEELLSGSWDLADSSTRLKILVIVIKAADIGASAKPWAISEQWGKRIEEEFIQMYQTEQEKEVPTTFPTPHIPPVAALMHLDSFVYPLFHLIDTIFPHSMSVPLQYLSEGRAKHLVNVPGASSTFPSPKEKPTLAQIHDLEVKLQRENNEKKDLEILCQQLQQQSKTVQTRESKVVSQEKHIEAKNKELEKALLLLEEKEKQTKAAAPLIVELQKKEEQIRQLLSTAVDQQVSAIQRSQGLGVEEEIDEEVGRKFKEKEMIIATREVEVRAKEAELRQKESNAETKVAFLETKEKRIQESSEQLKRLQAEAEVVLKEKADIQRKEFFFSQQQGVIQHTVARNVAAREMEQRSGIIYAEAMEFLTKSKLHLVAAQSVQKRLETRRDEIQQMLDREEAISMAIEGARERRRKVAQGRVVGGQGSTLDDLEKTLYAFTASLGKYAE